MNRLVPLLILLAIVTPLTPAALAQAGSYRHPVATQADHDELASKRAVYQRFLAHLQTNQPEAARAAQLYLEKYAADNDEVVTYLKKWVRRYDKATGADGFQEVSTACGVNVTQRTYRTRGGGRLYYTERHYESRELAEAALEGQLASAEGIVERRPVLDGQGLKVGERVVVKDAAGAVELRSSGKKLVRIEALTAEVTKDFEKAGRP